MPEATIPRRGVRTQPAEEVFRRPSVRTLAASALVAIAVVCLCNAAAGRLLEAFPQNRGYELIKAKWNLLIGLKRPVDVLVVGDSSCYLGIDPEVIESDVGGTALNLCTIGDMTAVGDYWMLDHYVRRFGPPRTVIIGHVHDIWHRSMSPILVEQVPVPDAFFDLYTKVLGFHWIQYYWSLARYTTLSR